MSRLYFQSAEVDVEVIGAERHYLGTIARDAADGVLCARETLLETGPEAPGNLRRFVVGPQPFPVVPVVPVEELHTRREEWLRHFVSAFHVGDTPVFGWRGYALPSLALRLNTAIVAGSDPVRLAARLDGQCEGHAWIAGQDRRWVADIILRGLRDGVFRETVQGAATGWRAVVAMLLASTTGPVVTSYSVTGDFLNPYNMLTLALDDDEKAEAFRRLPRLTRFARAMAALRGRERVGRSRQIEPTWWHVWRFDNRVTLQDLQAEDADDRLALILDCGDFDPNGDPDGTGSVMYTCNGCKWDLTTPIAAPAGVVLAQLVAHRTECKPRTR